MRPYAAIWLGLVLSSSPISLAHQAIAQTFDPDQLEKKIHENAQRYDKVVKLLNSGDATTRTSAFDGIMASGESELQEVALREAFASALPDMRARAFRGAFKNITRFHIKILENKSSASAGQLPPDTRWRGQSPHNQSESSNQSGITTGSFIGSRYDLEYDYTTGGFASRDDWARGNITSDTIFIAKSSLYRGGSIDSDQCTGTLHNKAGTWEFYGQMSCHGKGTFQGKLALR